MIKTPWPRFTKEGFKKIKLPDDIYLEFMLAYNQARFNEVQDDSYYDIEYEQNVAGGSVSIYDCPRPFYLRATIPPHIFARWAKRLQPMMEEWCGQELEFITGYGIRSYVRDSRLVVHRDEVATHLISLIVHIDEYPDVKWPLDFIDHDGKHHKVTFDKQDALLYESLCVHARDTLFTGEYYRNMYFHWCPLNWDPSPYEEGKIRYKSIQEALDEVN